MTYPNIPNVYDRILYGIFSVRCCLLLFAEFICHACFIRPAAEHSRLFFVCLYGMAVCCMLPLTTTVYRSIRDDRVYGCCCSLTLSFFRGRKCHPLHLFSLSFFFFLSLDFLSYFSLSLIISVWAYIRKKIRTHAGKTVFPFLSLISSS